MKRNISLLLVAVIVGVAFGALVSLKLTQDDSPGGQSAAIESQDLVDQVSVYDPSASELDRIADILKSLTDTLNEEIDERRLLSQQVERLQEDVGELQAEQRRRAERDPPPKVIDVRARDMRFAEMGFTEQDKEAIFDMVRASQVDQIELDDRARREGWINTQRYVEESQALFTYESPIRAELGDERYDRYLYAMGRPNRVVAGSIMHTSVAQKAGFQMGDVIVRYGGEPVFGRFHLVKLRSSGVADEPVVVEIYRNGRPMQVTIPRGPMGFGGSEISVDPRTNTPDEGP
jgi:hypothetical protein